MYAYVIRRHITYTYNTVHLFIVLTAKLINHRLTALPTAWCKENVEVMLTVFTALKLKKGTYV